MSHFLTYVILEAAKLEGSKLSSKEGKRRVAKVTKDLEKQIKDGLASGKMKISDAARARETIASTLADLPRFEAMHTELDRLLAPYDENIQVDPYQADCWCVGRTAQNDAREAADKAHGDLNSLRNKFAEIPGMEEQRAKTRVLYGRNAEGERIEPTEQQIEEARAVEEKMDLLWREFVRPWQETQKAAFAASPLKDKPDADCGTCNGTGKHESTYPNDIWRYFDAERREVDQSTGEKILSDMRAAQAAGGVSAGPQAEERSLPILSRLHEEEEPRTDSRTETALASATEIQAQPDGLRSDAARSEGSVRDMLRGTQDTPASGGPLSRDRAHSESAVCAVQQPAGQGPGQSGPATVSRGIPRKVLIRGARWDWYRMGGRYDGVITQTEPESGDNGFNFGSEHEAPERNTLKGSLLPEGDELRKILPFAIVTPDGQWHEKGSMGWWAIVSDEKEDWREQAVALLSKYRSDAYLIAACDLHI